MASYSPVPMIAASTLILNKRRPNYGGGGPTPPGDDTFLNIIAVGFIAILLVVLGLVVYVDQTAVETKVVINAEVVAYYHGGKSKNYTYSTVRYTIDGATYTNTSTESLSSKSCPRMQLYTAKPVYMTTRTHPWFDPARHFTGLSTFCVRD